MTETTSVDHAHSGRLTRTRLTVRTAIAIERLWPLLLPVLLIVALFVSLSWLGVFRLMPETARQAVAVLFAVAALAALYPLRFFRKPSTIEIDRRIERANKLQHNPVSVQSDRPSGRQASFADALWREHQRRMAEQLAAVSGDLPRTRVPERDPWALRAAVALLFVVAFAFSFGPLGGKVARRLPPAGRARRHTAAHRRLGDAAGLYRQGADLPHLRRQARARAVLHRPGRQRRVAARDRRLRRRDAELRRGLRQHPRHRRRTRRTVPAEPVATSAKPGARQFAGKLTADGMLSLKSGDAEHPQLGLCRDPGQAAGDPLLRRAEAGGQRHARAQL